MENEVSGPQLDLAPKLFYDFILTTVVSKAAPSAVGWRVSFRVSELDPPYKYNPPESWPSRPQLSIESQRIVYFKVYRLIPLQTLSILPLLIILFHCC